MRRMLLVLALAAVWTSAASAGEWNSMGKLRDCAAGECWQFRAANGSVVTVSGDAGAKDAFLALSSKDRSSRHGLAGSVPPLGKDEAKAKKQDEGRWGSVKRGVDKAWGFVKSNWPGIVGGIIGGILGSMFLGPFGAVFGSVAGTILGHFAAGFFGKKS